MNADYCSADVLPLTDTLLEKFRDEVLLFIFKLITGELSIRVLILRCNLQIREIAFCSNIHP